MRLTGKEKLELNILKKKLKIEQENLIAAKKKDIDENDDLIMDLEDIIFDIKKNINFLQD
tara:strand:- start:399 stop:578 length:180 start_codon:yes stop_codon:yes gene_type:complete